MGVAGEEVRTVGDLALVTPSSLPPPNSSPSANSTPPASSPSSPSSPSGASSTPSPSSPLRAISSQPPNSPSSAGTSTPHSSNLNTPTGVDARHQRQLVAPSPHLQPSAAIRLHSQPPHELHLTAPTPSQPHSFTSLPGKTRGTRPTSPQWHHASAHRSHLQPPVRTDSLSVSHTLPADNLRTLAGEHQEETTSHDQKSKPFDIPNESQEIRSVDFPLLSSVHHFQSTGAAGASYVAQSLADLPTVPDVRELHRTHLTSSGSGSNHSPTRSTAQGLVNSDQIQEIRRVSTTSGLPRRPFKNRSKAPVTATTHLEDQGSEEGLSRVSRETQASSSMSFSDPSSYSSSAVPQPLVSTLVPPASTSAITQSHAGGPEGGRTDASPTATTSHASATYDPSSTPTSTTRHLTMSPLPPRIPETATSEYLRPTSQAVPPSPSGTNTQQQQQQPGSLLRLPSSSSASSAEQKVRSGLSLQRDHHYITAPATAPTDPLTSSTTATTIQSPNDNGDADEDITATPTTRPLGPGRKNKNNNGRRRGSAIDSSSKIWIARPSPRPHRSTSSVTMVNVCDSDPCGEAACHPLGDKDPPFQCLCPNALEVPPGTRCPRNNTVPSMPNPTHTTNPPAAIFKNPYNLTGTVVSVSVLAMAVVIFLYWRRKSIYNLLRPLHAEKKPGPQSPGSIAKSSSLLTYNLASNPNYYTTSPDTPQPLHTLSVHLIHPEQISFTGELGEGCFGKVYKGTYGPRCPENGGIRVTLEGDDDDDDDDDEANQRRSRLTADGRSLEDDGSGGGGGEDEDDEGVSMTVAVKVLKESAGVEAEVDFMREVEIMSAFSHENILALIGIVAKGTGGTPWMVFEYMPYGDLAEVLRSCNKEHRGPTTNTHIATLTQADLLHISVQIASGMEYLSSQHFVHRDLACRNCLVGENLAVKISDFGMSRDVYTCDYYKVGGSRMLPVRWMALESIKYGKFTLESDVWSFGVVLWEIYSFGTQPYYGNSNESVVKLIFQGILLSPPDTCPAQVCDVMRRCWATEPAHRLKFPDILARLQRLQHEQKFRPTAPPIDSPALPPITYSELCLHDEGTFQLDADQYLVPKKHEPREYITVISGGDAAC